MGCVHPKCKSKTFYSFSYANSEEGLSTNNLSSTNLGHNTGADTLSHVGRAPRATDSSLEPRGHFWKGGSRARSSEAHTKIDSPRKTLPRKSCEDRTSTFSDVRGRFSETRAASVETSQKRQNLSLSRSKSEDKQFTNAVLCLGRGGVVCRSDNQLSLSLSPKKRHKAKR